MSAALIIHRARNMASDVETRALLLRSAVLEAMLDAPTAHDRAKIERVYNRAIKAHALLGDVTAHLSKLIGSTPEAVRTTE
jgi:hypothetical protein